MDGRHPEAIRLTFTNCTDRAHEAEFNTWYDAIYLPEILCSGLATTGTPSALTRPHVPASPDRAALDVATHWGTPWIGATWGEDGGIVFHREQLHIARAGAGV